MEVPAIAGVSVMDQVRRLTAPWSCLQDLPPDPSSCGAGGNVQRDEFTALVPHEKQDVESPEADVWTTNRSAAQTPFSSLLRKVRQF